MSRGSRYLMIWWRKDLLETLGAGLASTAWIHTQSRTTAYMHSMITMMNCPYHHVRQNIMVGRDGTTLARPALSPATGALRVAGRNQRRVAPAPARVSGSSKASPLNAACAPRLAVDQDERKQEAAASSHVAGVYSAARYQHPNLFPNPPEFDGSNVELYHHTMVEYNDIVRAKRHTTRTKDSNIWVKVPYQLASRVRLKLIADTYVCPQEMARYSDALHKYSVAIEARNLRVLQSVGGFRLPPSPPRPRQHISDYSASLPRGEQAVSIENFLSTEQATSLLTTSERVGYRELVISLARSERSNTRCVVTDHSLARQLWKMLQPYVRHLVLQLARWCCSQHIVLESVASSRRYVSGCHTV